jgi:NAD-dependent dihydropyrimidine dehydrogenase PreA subunit
MAVAAGQMANEQPMAFHDGEQIACWQRAAGRWISKQRQCDHANLDLSPLTVSPGDRVARALLPANACSTESVAQKWRPDLSAILSSASPRCEPCTRASILARMCGRSDRRGSKIETTKFRESETVMTYVIAEPCINTKDTACVDACPVDCIHPKKDEQAYATAELLYIDPVECIDCGACVPVCPVSAIFALDDLPEKWNQFTAINAAYYGR